MTPASQHRSNIIHTTVVLLDSSSLLNMADQPNTGRLAEAFAAASHEIALVPNLPTFDYGQHILQAIQGSSTNINTNINTMRTDLNTMRTDLNTMRTDLNTIRTDLNTISTDINTLNTKFDSLDELRMRAELAYFSPFSIVQLSHLQSGYTASRTT